MRWNISAIVELHFDVFDIEADSEDEATEIFKQRVSDNHNLDVVGYGEYQPSEINFDEINVWEDFNEE
jgi:hypothetical protein